MTRLINSSDLASSAPYSHAVVVDNIVQTPGIVAIDAVGKTIGVGDISKQTEVVIMHIARTLERAGSSLDHVYFCQIFLKDLQDYAAMNAVYARYFGLSKPARFCVGAALANAEWLVEIAVSARRHDGP